MYSNKELWGYAKAINRMTAYLANEKPTKKYNDSTRTAPNKHTC